jgi:lipid A 3-O-deacylase
MFAWVKQAFANFYPWRKLAGIFISTFIGLAGIVLPAQEQKGMLSFNEEDDSFGNPFATHQDRHYTQGLKVSLFGGDEFMPEASAWLNSFLPQFEITPSAADFGWVILGQNIYTPENLLSSAPVKNDRPYAGWLYTGPIFQRRHDLSDHFAVQENFEINVGIVGPVSLAEQAQTAVHRWWFPNDIPQGWGNQLKNEPGLVLKYEYQWRYSPVAETARYFDMLPHLGAEAGNVSTLATGGVDMRLGWNLPNNFGEQIIDSPATTSSPFLTDGHGFSAYFFGGVDGRAVAHDITLDGNSFRNGPSVEKYPFVADLSWGFAIQVSSHFEFAYIHVDRTKEFRGQAGNDIFGSLNLKLNFQF